MPGFLDQYGAGDERREKIVKRTILTLVVLLVAGGALYWTFKNYREEKQVKSFFERLANKDYAGAYRLWGCSDAKPCRDYPVAEFMKDWGPQGSHADAASTHIAKSRACGSGVILTIGFANKQEEKLWVQKDDLTIGYSPWPGCPPGR